VKVFGIITLIIALLIIILILMGGEHGPVRHRPSGGIDINHMVTLVATSRL